MSPPSTTLTIAIVLAAVFGAALLWLLVFFVHSYIHHRCLEVFHFLRWTWHRPCKHCEGTGLNFDLKEKSKSKSRSRSRGREKKNPRMIDAAEWVAVERPKAVQRQVLGEEQYDPWQGRQQQIGLGMAYPQQVMYPQAYSQMYPQQAPVQQQPYIQASAYTMPAPIPRQQAPRVAMPTRTSVSSVPHYQKPVRKAYTAPASERSEPRTKPRAPKHAHRTRDTTRTREPNDVLEVNYSGITTTLPPFLQKEPDAQKTAATKRPRSSSPCSNASSSPAEEVPRRFTPQVDPVAWYQTGERAAKYPSRGDEQVRYAAPEGVSGPEGRRHGPSETPL